MYWVLGMGRGGACRPSQLSYGLTLDRTKVWITGETSRRSDTSLKVEKLVGPRKRICHTTNTNNHADAEVGVEQQGTPSNHGGLHIYDKVRPC